METVPILLSNLWGQKRATAMGGGGVDVGEQELRHLIEIQLEQRGDSAPNHDVKDNLMRSEKHLSFEMQYLLTLLDFYQQISNLERKLSSDASVCKPVKSFSASSLSVTMTLGFELLGVSFSIKFSLSLKFKMHKGVCYEDTRAPLAREEFYCYILPEALEKGMGSHSIFIYADQTA